MEANSVETTEPHTSSRGKRAWPRPLRVLLTFGKGVTWLAGLAAAATAIAAWFPLAYEQIWWRDVAYEKLRNLGAGQSISFVEAALGTPIVSMSFDPDTGPQAGDELLAGIYRGQDYYAYTVSDTHGRVVLYSVLSCDAKFAPTLFSPMVSKVQLQTVPLSQAEHYSSNHDPNSRAATLVPPSTVSSLGQLIETGETSGSNSANAQYWFLGINSACGDLTAAGIELQDQSSPGQNSVIDAVRESQPANFYTETSSDVQAELGRDGLLTLTIRETTYSNVYVSPSPSQLIATNSY